MNVQLFLIYYFESSCLPCCRHKQCAITEENMTISNMISVTGNLSYDSSEFRRCVLGEDIKNLEKLTWQNRGDNSPSINSRWLHFPRRLSVWEISHAVPSPKSLKSQNLFHTISYNICDNTHMKEFSQKEKNALHLTLFLWYFNLDSQGLRISTLENGIWHSNIRENEA